MATKPSIGGQAVIEGVMMRGPASWAVAVRTPDGNITAETHTLPGHPQRYPFLKWPFVRGVYVLVESLSIGVRALRISALQALGEEERPSDKQIGWTMGIAMLFFSALFIALPAVAVKFGGRMLEQESELVQNVAESTLRIGIFVGYILLISLLPDIRRVFQYHGAEHKTIYAYENDDPLEPEVVDRYSTLHVRCGTNFLFIVLFLTLAAHLVLDLTLPPSIPIRVAARVLAIPFLAGIAYEVIRAASRKENSLPFRVMSLPGLALQKITTRPPSRDQIEVAIKAMESVIGREQLAAAREATAEPEPDVDAPLPPIVAPGPGGAPPGPA